MYIWCPEDEYGSGSDCPQLERWLVASPNNSSAAPALRDESIWKETSSLLTEVQSQARLDRPSPRSSWTRQLVSSAWRNAAVFWCARIASANGSKRDTNRFRLFASAPGETGRPWPASEPNHRSGLSVFVDKPQVPMDNDAEERALRGPVIGRRLSFGSDSETGARFTALMYSVVTTLKPNGIDVRRWLEVWLEAWAENGGRPPDAPSPWLPWSMNEERRRADGAGMTASVECRYYGRDFTAEEMALLRALIAADPPPNPATASSDGYPSCAKRTSPS